MDRLLAVALAWLTMAIVAPTASAQAPIVVSLPEATPAPLIDALRVELRARGERAALMLVPTDAGEPRAMASGVEVVLWLEMGDDPLRPPVARLRRGDAPIRSASLPAALDVIQPRLFALSLTSLLDAPAELPDPPTGSVALSEPVPSSPDASDDAASDEVAAEEPHAQDAPPPFDPGEPPTIHHPFLGLRLALGAGALAGPAPFYVGGSLDIDVEYGWVVFNGDVTVGYVPDGDLPLVWGGLGLGGRARGLPGTLTVVAQGGVALTPEGMGPGGGLQVRWEWPIEELLRIGPRIAFQLWHPMAAVAPNADPVGWMLHIGVDLVGLDMRL